MASVPQAFPLRKEDFPSGLASKEDFNRFASQFNTFLRQTQSLGQAVNVAQNVDGTVTTFTVTTPTTDWVAPTLLGTWVNYTGGFAPAGYRKDSAGIVWVRGLIKLGTINTTAFTLPAGFVPSSDGILLFAAIDGVGSAQRLDVYPDGSVIPKSGNTAFFSLQVAFPAADNSPGVYACWPQQVKLTSGRQPLGVLPLGVVDTVQSSSTPAIAPGIPSWTYSPVQAGAPNLLTINNITGLALGRSYTVTLLVVYAP